MLYIAQSVLIPFFIALFCIHFLRSPCEKIGLVDIPNKRKVHSQNIPLMGGIALLFGWLGFNISQGIPNIILLMTATTISVTGIIDDIRGLSAKLRLFIQLSCIFILAFFDKVTINHLGNPFAFGAITLGLLSLPFTMITGSGIINAFNMIDGIDGLLGMMSLIAFGCLALLFTLNGDMVNAAMNFAIIACLVAYLLSNLTIPPFKRKIFMGDGGSTLIGFLIIYMLYQSTQSDTAAMSPVTALWIVAFPLMDMVSTISRRLMSKRPVFAPAKDHLHHIMLANGHSHRQALAVISICAFTFAFVGVISDYYNLLPEWAMCLLFIIAYLLYFRTLEKLDNNKDAVAANQASNG